jgi:hypothetical protein
MSLTESTVGYALPRCSATAGCAAASAPVHRLDRGAGAGPRPSGAGKVKIPSESAKAAAAAASQAGDGGRAEAAANLEVKRIRRLRAGPASLPQT